RGEWHTPNRDTEPAGAERGNRSPQQVNDVVRSGCMAKRRKVGRASLQVDHDCSGRWGVILAGGDGKRLLPLTRKLTGEERPKQFCALSGPDTLLKETWQRVSHVVPPSHMLLGLTRTHERFYGDHLRGIPTCNVLVQPYNRGTAPAIVSSVTRLQAVAPNGVVGFFPSDHHFKHNATLVG